MVYQRRVVKRRPSSLSEEEWLQVFERGKLPRPDLVPRDGASHPPCDVYDLVLQRELDDLRWRLEQLCMAMLDPNVRRPGNGSSTSAARVGELLAPFSELWAFLSGITYASGKPRQMGHLSLRLDADGVKVTLTDPTSHSYCTRTAECLDEALLTLEMGLKDGSLNWLPSSFGNGKK